jgi:diacylglycerol kinase family enzyme
VTYFQAESLVCRAAGPTPFELDGEDAGDAPVAFSVLPRALRVIVPKSNRGDIHA